MLARRERGIVQGYSEGNHATEDKRTSACTKERTVAGRRTRTVKAPSLAFFVLCNRHCRLPRPRAQFRKSARMDAHSLARLADSSGNSDHSNMKESKWLINNTQRSGDLSNSAPNGTKIKTVTTDPRYDLAPQSESRNGQSMLNLAGHPPILPFEI